MYDIIWNAAEMLCAMGATHMLKAPEDDGADGIYRTRKTNTGLTKSICVYTLTRNILPYEITFSDCLPRWMASMRYQLNSICREG